VRVSLNELIVSEGIFAVLSLNSLQIIQRIKRNVNEIRFCVDMVR
jgi:hypothetical protein